MVQATPATSSMGQSCGANAPLTDSFPSLNSVPSMAMNGETTENQATLSLLLANSHEFTSHDLSLKLRAVLNENFDLKETVMQNNLAMKHQLELLRKWKEQVKQKEAQASKEIDEAKQKIESLQRENQFLRNSRLGSANVSESSKFEELNSTIKELDCQNKEIEEELKRSKHEKEELLSQKFQLEADNTILNVSLNASKGETEKLQMQRSDFIKTIKELREAMEQEHHQMIRNPSARNDRNPDLLVLQRQLDNEIEAKNTLMQALNDGKNQIDILQFELKQSKSDADKFTRLYDEISKDSHSDVDVLEKKLMHDQITTLRKEMKSLEESLSKERNNNSQQFEVDILKKELAQLRRSSDHQSHQAKVKSLTEQHDLATAKLVSYEDLLESKSSEISALKKQLGEAKAQLSEVHSEGDTIAVLRAQIEVYQGDFRAEREAREVLASEREQLRDQIHDLQTRNLQVTEELSRYQRRVAGTGAEGGSSTEEVRPSELTEFSWDKLSVSSDTKDKEKPLVELKYSCPICNKQFDEETPLEEHVNRCLDGN